MDEQALMERAADAWPSIGRAGWLTPERVDAPELLDRDDGSEQDVVQSLDDLRRINRYLGGLRALTLHLFPRLRAAEGTLTCLDLGAGTAQLAAVIGRWARREQREARVIALDLSARHLALAREWAGEFQPLLLQADAARLPLRHHTVDYVVSSLFLHHFSPDAAVELLRSSFAVARRGLVITDLVRAWPPLLAFSLLQPVFARSPITRHDAIVSMRRGYTTAELMAFARAAGLPNPRIHRHFPWRMTLVADK